MKKIIISLLAVALLLVTFSLPAVAQSDHKNLNGCQVDPNGTTYTVNVGAILGLPFLLVEELGACCIRGYWESPEANGFPGGCCKHPWLEPGPPPTENPFPESLLVGEENQHPGQRENPSDVPQVGHGCKCGAINPANTPL
jgi:hypothetical protein